MVHDYPRKLFDIPRQESAAALEEKEEEVLELELQLESLREEMETLKEAGGTVQVAVATDGATPDMVELATENAKLRQALHALNDQSKERIADLTRSVRKFEKDAKELTKLKKQFNEQKTQNEELKADVEDLKGRLDDAGSYEEMVEELSDENMSMKDKLAELENNLKRQKESVDKWKQAWHMLCYFVARSSVVVYQNQLVLVCTDCISPVIAHRHSLTHRIMKKRKSSTKSSVSRWKTYRKRCKAKSTPRMHSSRNLQRR